MDNDFHPVCFADVVRYVGDYIKKGSNTFALGPGQTRNTFALAVGAQRVLNFEQGFMLCIGLSREQVEILRDQCNAMLQQQ